MIQRRDVKAMMQSLTDGDIAGYLPDQDYGRRRVEFVKFLKYPMPLPLWAPCFLLATLIAK